MPIRQSFTLKEKTQTDKSDGQMYRWNTTKEIMGRITKRGDQKRREGKETPIGKKIQ